MSIQKFSTITCPHCGYQKREEMPEDACQFFYQRDISFGWHIMRLAPCFSMVTYKPMMPTLASARFQRAFILGKNRIQAG